MLGFMRAINRQLNNAGYKTKEKAMVYTGIAAGALAPIIGARYTFFNSFNDGPLEELVAWSGSLLLNFSTMFIPPHLPLPVYTAGVGTIVGDLAAKYSKQVRLEKESELGKDSE